MANLLDQLYDAIQASEQTRYRISKGSGVSQPQLSRFVNEGQQMTVEKIELIADYLGLEVVLQPKKNIRSSTAKTATKKMTLQKGS